MPEGVLDILETDCGALRTDLITSRQATAQGNRVFVRDPESGKTFLFSEGAFCVLQSLKAGRPARCCIAGAFPNGLERAPATLRLIIHAHESSLLIGGELTAADTRNPGVVHRVAKWNPFYVQVPLLNPQRAVRGLRPFAKVLFHPWTFGVWISCLLVLFAALAFTPNRYVWELGIFRHFAWWPVLYVALAISSFIHELGHILLCDRYGVVVNQVGILIYFLNPGAYADASGAWMLPQRRKRVAIALAGLYAESVLWMVVTAYWLITRSGALHEMAFVFGLCLASRIITNLIPFLRLDGYWVLADTLGVPNLRSSAFRYLRSRIPGFFHSGERTIIHKRQASILLIYALAALVFLSFMLIFTLRNLFVLMGAIWPNQPATVLWAYGFMLFVLSVLGGLNLAARFRVWTRNIQRLDT